MAAVAVIAMETASEPIHGELTEWFLEIKAGVFVGNVNARIRDLLWNRIRNCPEGKGAVPVYSSNHEQGFDMRLAGMPTRAIVDFDGIKLVKIEHYRGHL